MHDDFKIVKFHKGVRLPDELTDFPELSKVEKAIKISAFLQQIYCHVRTGEGADPSSEALAKSYLLKEYSEFFLVRHVQDEVVDFIFLNFVRGGMGINKCVEPSDWPTICRQDTIKQVFLMFLFLALQNAYYDEIGS